MGYTSKGNGCRFMWQNPPAREKRVVRAGVSAPAFSMGPSPTSLFYGAGVTAPGILARNSELTGPPTGGLNSLFKHAVSL